MTAPAQGIHVGGLFFSGDFDAGRLEHVSIDEDGAFCIMVPSDCQELGLRNEYRVYYCFSVSGGTPGSKIRCRIQHLHQIAKLYNPDLRPLCRVPSISPGWERLREACSFAVSDALELEVAFDYTFVSTEPAFFAFYHPFSYADCQRLLTNVGRALPLIGALTASASDEAVKAIIAAAAPYPGSVAARKPIPEAVYFHRELLCHSPDGRRVELLTITSVVGITQEREATIEGLFPEAASAAAGTGAGAQGTPPAGATAPQLRPHRFRDKPGIFVSARVHPGETASSYMVHGLVAFLLQPRNPHARALRNAFVWKIIPMLNPDGVARGHFRLDQFGVNLNRAYARPHPRWQPSIYAAKAVLRQIAATCAPVSLQGPTRHSRVLSQSPSGLFVYLDLHAYSSREGCYLLGNALPPTKLVRQLAFSFLVQTYAPQFSAAACSLGQRRVGIGAGSGAGADSRPSTGDEGDASGRSAGGAGRQRSDGRSPRAAASGAGGGAKLSKGAGDATSAALQAARRGALQCERQHTVRAPVTDLLAFAESLAAALPEPPMPASARSVAAAERGVRALGDVVGAGGSLSTPPTHGVASTRAGLPASDGAMSARRASLTGSAAAGSLGARPRASSGDARSLRDAATLSGASSPAGDGYDSEGSTTSADSSSAGDAGSGLEEDATSAEESGSGFSGPLAVPGLHARLGHMLDVLRVRLLEPQAEASGARGGAGGGVACSPLEQLPCVAAAYVPALQAIVLDPTASLTSGPLRPGVRRGPADARLHDSDTKALGKRWRAMKARADRDRDGSAAAAPAAASSEPGLEKPIDAAAAQVEARAVFPPLQHPIAARSGAAAAAAATAATAAAASGPKETAKSGTGRVSVYKEFGCLHSYTVEASCSLASHTTVLQRACMFGPPSLLQQAVSPGSRRGGGADTTLRYPFAGQYAQASQKLVRPPPGAAAGGGGSGVCFVIDCPNASAAPISQIDAASSEVDGGVASLAPRRAIRHPYLCQVDSLQPPTASMAPAALSPPAAGQSVGGGGTAGGSAALSPQRAGPPPGQVGSPVGSGSSGLAADGGMLLRQCTASAFQPPFGLPVVRLPGSPRGQNAFFPEPQPLLPPATGSPFSRVAPVPCAWGTCPHDPPAAFAAVGRALALAVAELASLTVAKEAGDSSLIPYPLPPPGTGVFALGAAEKPLPGQSGSASFSLASGAGMAFAERSRRPTLTPAAFGSAGALVIGGSGGSGASAGAGARPAAGSLGTLSAGSAAASGGGALGAVPASTPLAKPLPSRLPSTWWRSVAGLHSWLRVLLGVEDLPAAGAGAGGGGVGAGLPVSVAGRTGGASGPRASIFGPSGAGRPPIPASLSAAAGSALAPAAGLLSASQSTVAGRDGDGAASRKKPDAFAPSQEALSSLPFAAELLTRPPTAGVTTVLLPWARPPWVAAAAAAARQAPPTPRAVAVAEPGVSSRDAESASAAASSADASASSHGGAMTPAGLVSPASPPQPTVTGGFPSASVAAFGAGPSGLLKSKRHSMGDSAAATVPSPPGLFHASEAGVAAVPRSYSRSYGSPPQAGGAGSLTFAGSAALAQDRPATGTATATVSAPRTGDGKSGGGLFGGPLSSNAPLSTVAADRVAAPPTAAPSAPARALTTTGSFRVRLRSTQGTPVAGRSAATSPQPPVEPAAGGSTSASPPKLDASLAHPIAPSHSAASLSTHTTSAAPMRPPAVGDATPSGPLGWQAWSRLRGTGGASGAAAPAPDFLRISGSNGALPEADRVASVPFPAGEAVGVGQHGRPLASSTAGGAAGGVAGSKPRLLGFAALSAVSAEGRETDELSMLTALQHRSLMQPPAAGSDVRVAGTGAIRPMATALGAAGTAAVQAMSLSSAAALLQAQVMAATAPRGGPGSSGAAPCRESPALPEGAVEIVGSSTGSSSAAAGSGGHDRAAAGGAAVSASHVPLAPLAYMRPPLPLGPRPRPQTFRAFGRSPAGVGAAAAPSPEAIEAAAPSLQP